MESQRNLLLIGFAVRELLALATVGVRQGSKPAPTTVAQTEHFVPEPVRPVIFLRFTEQANGNAARKLITVSSIVLKLTLDTQGGDIALPNCWPQAGKAEQPFTLLTSQPAHLMVAQSGLVGRNGPGRQPGPGVVPPMEPPDQLSAGRRSGSSRRSDDLDRQRGKWSSPRSSCVKRGDYAVGVDYKIDNKSAGAGPGTVLRSAEADHDHAEGSGRSCHGGQCLTVVVPSSEDSRYKKYTFDEMKDADSEQDHPGWFGSPCCSTTSSPTGPRDANDTNSFYSRVIRAGPGHHRLQGAAG